LRQPTLVYLAALFFVLAVYTKQTVILGAIAAFAGLLAYKPASAARGAIFAVLLGGLALAILTVATDGRVFRHIFFYNISPFSWRALFANFHSSGIISKYPIELILALAIAALLAYRLLTRPLWSQPAVYLIVLVYFLLTTANALSIGKLGG